VLLLEVKHFANIHFGLRTMALTQQTQLLNLDSGQQLAALFILGVPLIVHRNGKSGSTPHVELGVNMVCQVPVLI
jgi:hypothetical protein